MKFFQQLSEIGVENLELKVTIKNDILSVIIIPNIPNKTFIPLTVSGSAEELDEEFFDVINTPLKKAAGLVTNVGDFEKSLEEKPARKSTKTSKTKEVEESDDESDDSEEKPAKTTRKSKSAAGKKPEPYKYQKYLDAILEIVNTEGYVLTEENKHELADKVNMLLVMDAENAVALEWDEKIRNLSKAEEKHEEVEKNTEEAEAEPELKPEEKEEVAIEEEEPTVKGEPAVIPPPPPADEDEEEDDDDSLFNDDDLDFESFFSESE